MQEVDIWQSLAENAQSCIMTISKDKGDGKISAKSFNLFFCNADYQSQKNTSDFTNLLPNH